MEVFSDKKTSKNIQNFYCEYCDFKCCKKGDWERHIKRRKHLKVINCDNLVTIKTSTFKCELCEKEYVSRNGLWVQRNVLMKMLKII